MADYTQAELELAAHAYLAHPDVVAEGAVNVASYLEGEVYIYHAEVETADPTAGVKYHVQASPSASGNEDWVTLATFETTHVQPVKADISGAEAGGQTSIDVGADPTSDFDDDMVVYLRDTNGGSPASATGDLTGDELNGEWARVDYTETGGTHTIHLVDGLTNAKDSSDDILTEAAVFHCRLMLGGTSRLRLLVVHRAATGNDLHYKATLLAATDLE